MIRTVFSLLTFLWVFSATIFAADSLQCFVPGDYFTTLSPNPNTVKLEYNDHPWDPQKVVLVVVVHSVL
jgi:hypothetical protein